MKSLDASLSEGTQEAEDGTASPAIEIRPLGHMEKVTSSASRLPPNGGSHSATVAETSTSAPPGPHS